MTIIISAANARKQYTTKKCVMCGCVYNYGPSDIQRRYIYDGTQIYRNHNLGIMDKLNRVIGVVFCPECKASHIVYNRYDIPYKEE